MDDWQTRVDNCQRSQFKASATLQDRPRADRCSAFISLINPNKPHIFSRSEKTRKIYFSRHLKLIVHVDVHQRGIILQTIGVWQFLFMRKQKTFEAVVWPPSIARKSRADVRFIENVLLFSVVGHAILGSLRIDDFRTTTSLGHLIVPRRRPVEIWIYDSRRRRRPILRPFTWLESGLKV